jgi:hypothetical protein
LSRPSYLSRSGSLGVAPVVEVPLLAIVGGLAALVVVGKLLAALPATMAARTRPGVSLPKRGVFDKSPNRPASPARRLVIEATFTT